MCVVVMTYSKIGRLWIRAVVDSSCCGSFIYLRYYINACVTFLLKVGFHWIFPRDCTVGLP